jgi:hypothetical protein
MNNSNPYFKELDEIHVELAALFDGSADEGALQRIMARFAPQFTLVMTSGIALDHAGLRETFSKLRGARPGSQISIRDKEIVAEYPSGGGGEISRVSARQHRQRECAALHGGDGSRRAR